MYKETSYTEKFRILEDRLPKIIELIKKEIKNEHLKNDRLFHKQHFSGKSLNKISVADLVGVYGSLLKEDEELGEFVANRWVLKHTDTYEFFLEQLGQIDPNFQDLEEISTEQSKSIIDQALPLFGAEVTYLFCVLNSVVFSEEAYGYLKAQIPVESRESVSLSSEACSIDELVKKHEREMQKIADKYEKKLSGMQKKYLVDTTSLKKQLGNLQRKLQEQQS